MPEGETGAQLKTALLNMLQEDDLLDVFNRRLVGVSTDAASVMYGEKIGFRGQLRRTMQQPQGIS